MPNITIALSDDHWQQLQAQAARRGVAPEELVRAHIEEMLSEEPVDEPEADFERAAAYVLQKNAELYRRLA